MLASLMGPFYIISAAEVIFENELFYYTECTLANTTVLLMPGLFKDMSIFSRTMFSMFVQNWFTNIM